MRPIFITGIGTGIGKTLISAIVTEALAAHYWKPVQAGFADGTDSEWVGERISALAAQGAGAGVSSRVAPELYKLKLPASPHIAAREEGIVI
ncbi:MAG TPA: AAA family ATPase, partial [Puia sp.]|nr:AAA family ATPase [Puia sp.]